MRKKLFEALLVFTLLLIAFSAGAMTNEEILSRITALETELAGLRGLVRGLATSVEPAVAPAPVVSETEAPAPIAAVSCHKSAPWAWDYCATNCPCQAGEGDCDTSQHCLTGYCALDVGAKYGQTKTTDVCEEKPALKQASAISAGIPTGVAQIAPLVFNMDDVLTIRGAVIAQGGNEPIVNAVAITKQDLFGLPIEQVFGATNNKGVFEIKLNKQFDLNKNIFFRTGSHLSPSFYLCADCKGYALALVENPLLGSQVIFPVSAAHIDMGDVFVQEAADIVLFSDRFVSASVEYQKQGDALAKSAVFVKTAENSDKKQKHSFLDSAPLDADFKLVLTDRQGKDYVSPLFQAQTTTQKPISLVFWNNEFSAGVCGNNVCEREEIICPSDCQNACLDSQGQGLNKCLFGCEGSACKKDVLLSFPNTTEEFTAGQKLTIEWASNGLENEKFDLELLAFNEQGALLADFQHLIATSAPSAANQYEWIAPALKQQASYKAVIYNKMCLGGNETLVSCLTNRYLDKSDNYFTIKEKETPLPFAQTQIASISQAASALAEKIKQLLGR